MSTNNREAGIAKREDRIINATMELIGQYDIDEITIRNIAKLANVTPPTLYNRFGSKDDLIAAALKTFYDNRVNKYLTDDFNRKNKVYKRILEIADLYHESCLNFTRHVKAIMSMHFKMENYATVQSVYEDNCHTFRVILDAMDNTEELLPNVDKEYLSRLIADSCYLSALYWCQGRLNEAELKKQLTFDCASLLINFVKPTIAEELKVIIFKHTIKG